MTIAANRRVLTAGLCAATGLAGLGFALWRDGAGRSKNPAVDALWDLKLELPQGGELAFKTLRGKPLVLNFWATWCPPCIEELPLLDAFYRENSLKGWQMVGIAVDNAKAVNQFLAKSPLAFMTPLAGLQGVDLSKSMGNLSGGLPFTVVLNTTGDVAVTHMGKLSADQIQQFATIK